MSTAVPEVSKAVQDIETEKFIERAKNNPVVFQTMILDRVLETFQKQSLVAPFKVRENRRVRLKLLSRDSGKSWTDTIGESTREVCKDPNTAIQIIAESQSTAKLFLTEIKLNLERNEKIHRYFGRHKPTDRLTPWSMTQIVSGLRTEIRKEPTIEIFGCNGAIVGRHVPIQKLDDISTLKTAATPDKREKIVNWYNNVVKYCLELGGKLDIQGTRYYPGDFYEYLLNLWGPDILFRVPALTVVEPKILERYNPIEKENDITIDWLGSLENGDACDVNIGDGTVERSFYPKRASIDALFEERKNNAVGFSLQRQNDVSVVQSQFVQADKVIVVKESEIPPFREMVSYISADPASGTKRHHDMFSCTINCFHPDSGIIYTVYNDASRYGDTISMMDHLKKLYHYIVQERGGTCGACGIESNAFQKVLAQTMQKMGDKYGMIPVQQLSTLTDKEQRFVALAWFVNSGRCRFSDKCTRLINDIIRFPNVDEDDRVDSWMLGLELITKNQVMTKAFRVNIRDLDMPNARMIGF